jgi:methyl-accepting chemotaxis protein
MKLSLAGKLGIGFALVSALAVGSALVTYWKISTIRDSQNQLLSVRVPTMATARDLMGQYNESLNKTREYILMVDDPEVAGKARSKWEEAGKNIDADLQKLQELSTKFLFQANKDRVSQLVERNAEARSQMEHVFQMRKKKDAASEAAAGKFMSYTVTPFNSASKTLATELISSMQKLVDDDSVKTQADASSAIAVLGVATLLVVLFGIAIAIFLSRRISTEVGNVLARAKAIAAGDLSGKPLEPKSQDEVAELALAVNEMTESLRKLIGEITQGVQTVASSATQLSAASAQTADGVKSMSEKSATVAAAAEESCATSSAVSSSMERASSNLTSVAGATEQMSSTVAEISSNSEKARVISEKAMAQAQTISTIMAELGRAAQEIGKVTETITDISAQTNLLALNATIEAARAGSAGKGFAVVANEIKELAKQTSEATEDIKAKIAGVQNSTSGAVKTIETITGVIQEIGNTVAGTAAAIEEQASAKAGRRWRRVPASCRGCQSSSRCWWGNSVFKHTRRHRPEDKILDFES